MVTPMPVILPDVRAGLRRTLHRSANDRRGAAPWPGRPRFDPPVPQAWMPGERQQTTTPRKRRIMRGRLPPQTQEILTGRPLKDAVVREVQTGYLVADFATPRQDSAPQVNNKRDSPPIRPGWRRVIPSWRLPAQSGASVRAGVTVAQSHSDLLADQLLLRPPRTAQARACEWRSRRMEHGRSLSSLAFWLWRSPWPLLKSPSPRLPHVHARSRHSGRVRGRQACRLDPRYSVVVVIDATARGRTPCTGGRSQDLSTSLGPCRGRPVAGQVFGRRQGRDLQGGR